MIREQVFREELTLNFNIKMGHITDGQADVKLLIAQDQEGLDKITQHFFDEINKLLIKEVQNPKCIAVYYTTSHTMKHKTFVMKLHVACCSSWDDRPFQWSCEDVTAFDLEKCRAEVATHGSVEQWIESCKIKSKE